SAARRRRGDISQEVVDAVDVGPKAQDAGAKGKDALARILLGRSVERQERRRQEGRAPFVDGFEPGGPASVPCRGRLTFEPPWTEGREAELGCVDDLDRSAAVNNLSKPGVEVLGELELFGQCVAEGGRAVHDQGEPESESAKISAQL